MMLMETVNITEEKMTVNASGQFSDPEWAKFCTPTVNPFDAEKVEADKKKILKTRYERARQMKKEKASACN